MSNQSIEEQSKAPVLSNDIDFQNSSQKEIDLSEIFSAIWQGKWIIIFTTFVFSMVGVLYALSKPNIYTAQAVLSPAKSNDQNGMAAMAAQFGGLASLAGINLSGGSSDDKTISVATMQSRKFVNQFIKKHDLLVPLLAAKEWNPTTRELTIDPELYDVNNKKWVREVSGTKSVVPSDWEAYQTFTKGVFNVGDIKENGLTFITITHISPDISKQWVDWLVDDINAWMKKESLNQSKKNIEFLQQQLNKTTIADMRSVFFQLIEEQTKNLMLAEVEDQFAFKVIDPAVVPEQKVGPKRPLICIMFAFLGGVIGISIALGLMVFKKYKNNHQK